MHADYPAANEAVYPIHAMPVQAVEVEMVQSDWTTDLCDCCKDVSSCVDVMFCHYCQASRQYNVLTYNAPVMDVWTVFGPLIIDLCVGCNLGTSLLTWLVRQRLRLRYGIRGHDFYDCFVSFFLFPFALCQHYREMSVRGEWPGGCLTSAPFMLGPAPIVMDQPTASQQPTKDVVEL